MGAVTLASVRNTVRLRGDYPRSAKFTDAYVNGEIQAAWSELYELLVDTNEGYFDTSSTVSTVASQAYVALPATCWRVLAVDRLDGSDYVELAQVSISDRNRFSATADKPTAYRATARGIDLFPTPNAIYTLRVSFVPMVTALSETTTTQLYNSWEEYVVAGALLRMYQREERPIGEIMNELARCRDRISRGADQRQQQEPQYLPLFEDDWSMV